MTFCAKSITRLIITYCYNRTQKAHGRGRYKYNDEIINTVISNGIKLDTFYRRVRNGWSIDDASTISTGSIKINTQNNIWRKWESERYAEKKYYSKIRKMQE